MAPNNNNNNKIVIIIIIIIIIKIFIQGVHFNVKYITINMFLSNWSDYKLRYKMKMIKDKNGQLNVKVFS